MIGRLSRFTTVVGLSAALACTGYPGVAVAEMLGTDAVVETRHGERLDRVQAVIAREDVARTLQRLGVDPEEAKRRVAALTEAELARLEGRIDAVPAGAGLAEAIGIVFVVLIVLELVGITDIFTAL